MKSLTICSAVWGGSVETMAAGSLARWITGQDPTKRQRIGSITRPERGSCADLHRSRHFAGPVQRVCLPARFWVLEDLFQGWQAEAADTRSANGVLGAFGRWIMEHGIQSARREQGHLLM